MSVVPFPITEVEKLRRERDLLLEQVRILGACHMIERFHAFDAIKDDKCPCCGSRVRVNRTHNSVMLEAL